jgi:ABC-2 type transport system permease protein
LLLVLTSLWAVVFSSFMQLIALQTRSAAATKPGGLVFLPLLFLTGSFMPRDLLTRPMEIAATFNPVTYVMEALRSLILQRAAHPRPQLTRRTSATPVSVLTPWRPRLYVGPG